jgi:hypothetical protein
MHLTRATTSRKAVISCFLFELRVFADAYEKVLEGTAALRSSFSRRIREDGAPLMLFNRYRGVASDGFIAASGSPARPSPSDAKTGAAMHVVRRVALAGY